MDTEQRGQTSLLPQGKDEGVVFFCSSGFFLEKKGLLPQSRVAVNSIRRETDMEFPLDPDEQFDCGQRISPAKEKVIIRTQSGKIQDIFPEPFEIRFDRGPAGWVFLPDTGMFFLFHEWCCI
jgi:hypothetical protein